MPVACRRRVIEETCTPETRLGSATESDKVVAADELLVARQADDGGAGELLRRHGAAGGRRGVGQVPRRHATQPSRSRFGRWRACGRAGRRRWRPAGSSRHAESRRENADAKTPRRGRTECRKAARGRAKSKRTPQANRAARRRRRRGAATAARPGSCAGGSRSRLDGGRGRETARETKRTAPRSAESAGRKHARTARSRRPARSSAGSRRPMPRRWRGALLGQRPAGDARALVDVVGVARGGVDVGVPAVPIAVQHHRAGGGPRFLDSSARRTRRTTTSCVGRGRVPHDGARSLGGGTGSRWGPDPLVR